MGCETHREVVKVERDMDTKELYIHSRNSACHAS